MKSINKYVKLFLCLIIMLIGLTFSTNKISAASYPSKLTNVKKGAILKYNGFDSMYYKTSGSYKVFCTTFHVSNVGSSCSLASKQWSTPIQAGVAAIIDKYNTNKTQKNYYYSELAINEFLYYYSSKNKVNRISTIRNVRNTSGVKTFYDVAVKAYNEAKKTYSIKISTSSGNLKFNLSGDYYISEKITVSATNGSLGNYKTNLSGVTNAKIYNKSGNAFYIRIPKSSVKIGNSITVKLVVEATKTYHIAKKFSCNGTSQDLTPNITTNNSVKAKANKTSTITLKGNKTNIIKKDKDTKKALAGATLVVKNKNGKIVDTWVSTNEAHTLKNLEAGDYTLTETKAPKGYNLSKEEIKFTVKNDNKTIEVEMLNEKIPVKNKVEISKQDVTTKEELPGATLVVKDANGKVIDSWVSTNEVHIIADLTPGDYTLTETIAPDGYKLSEEAVKFTVKGDGTTTKVVMYNAPKDSTVVNIIKKDKDTKKALAGATLVVKNKNGKVVDTWVSTNEAHTLKNLEAGDYTLTETIAPEGYNLSKEEIKFTVKNDNKTIEVEMLNEKIPVKNKVEISKQDVTTKEELPGATLVVKDVNGKVIDSWVSTNEVHIIADLTPGDYTLTETIAPDGYKLSEETVKFTVKGDGTTTKVVMYNSKDEIIPTPKPDNPKHPVEISKQDITTKEELPGATLIVKDANGNEVARWVSGTTPYYLELDEGNYTLTEIQAPNGYDLSYEVVKFTVTNTTEVTKVIMYNSKTPNTSDKNIILIVSLISVAISGIGLSLFKLRQN